MSTDYIFFFFAFACVLYVCVFTHVGRCQHKLLCCLYEEIRGRLPCVGPKAYSTLCLRQAGDPGILGAHLFSAFHLALSSLAGVPYHAWLYNDVRSEKWNLGSYICNLSFNFRNCAISPSPKYKS